MLSKTSTTTSALVVKLCPAPLTIFTSHARITRSIHRRTTRHMPTSHMSHQSITRSRSTSVLPGGGSTPSERINSITAASAIARSPPLFNFWASTVSLIPPLDGEPTEGLPLALQALVAASNVIPSWICDPLSLKYNHIRRRFSGEISTFSALSTVSFTKSDDQGLSEDTETSLAPIFEVVGLMHRLRRHPLARPNEADRRLGVDHLASHVWNFSNDESLIHKLECAVQLPHSAASPVEEARPDSAVFFQLETSTLARLPTPAVLPCSSMALRQSSVPDYVLHWVTEYERDHVGTSKRQAWMVMTSGLYQRRSLGFRDHFVFGTAHHSLSRLTVFAGQWDNRPGQDQIVIYTLGTFQTESTIDMLRYFLLMRDARRLALEYKVSIDDKAPGLATQIHLSQPSLNSWVEPKSKQWGKGGSTPEARGALSAPEMGGHSVSRHG